MIPPEPPSGLYLFLGPDRARKLGRIQSLEQALRVEALDRHHLAGGAVSSADLVALCRQRPAASPVRLIVVDEAQRLDGACIEALRHHAAAIAETACVVLLVDEELSVRHPLAPFQRDAERTRGVALTTERFPGRDAPAVTPFALVDALGSRDVAGALGAVRDQVVNGKDPVELFGLVGWQLQRWVLVRRLLDAGYAAAQIAAVTGLKPWQVERVQSEVAGRSLALLHRLLARCWQLDVQVKRGLAIPGLAVEHLVMEVCQAAGGE